MTLPKILAAHQTIEVEGSEIDIRALTRAEAARFQKMSHDGKPLADLEIAVIAAGTDTPLDETKAWYESTPSHAVNEVITAIRDLSRLDEEAQKSG
jgi:hypothetical protein